jgi:uncharacterized protein YecE (DUF72 family)
MLGIGRLPFSSLRRQGSAELECDKKQLSSPESAMAEKNSNPSISWFIGTVGFSYPAWIRNFYPRGLPAAERLAFYAHHFNAVEIDTTFHAIPPSQTVRRWANVTPPDFRFCIKAPREITHGSAASTRIDEDAAQNSLGYLLDSSTLQTMRRFLGVVNELGDKLAVVLLQFPHTFRADRGEILSRFIDHFPQPSRLAIEFRHKSWWTSEIKLALEQRGISWVAADRSLKNEAADIPSPEQRESSVLPIVPTADFLYVRWLGRRRQFPDYKTERFDSTRRLKWWHQQLQHIQNTFPKIRTIYGFIDDDFAGNAPKTARRFCGCVGFSSPETFVMTPNQPTLFGD